ncbi:hypothetical protein B0H34DRAFT_675950 [Crassisporium funariophilum]|nr:hypothetical protein B0H34DRAFT_675950 [Crassisporium funariophilum]
MKPRPQATAHGFQKLKPRPQAFKSHAKSSAWPGFWRLALAGLGLQAKAGTSLKVKAKANGKGKCQAAPSDSNKDMSEEEEVGQSDRDKDVCRFSLSSVTVIPLRNLLNQAAAAQSQLLDKNLRVFLGPEH